MQARKLRTILNDTKYIVGQKKDAICIGSPMCSDLITVNKTTLKMNYALDTFSEGGRQCLQNKGKSTQELLFIWDTLEKIIADGTIKGIIEGNDTIENPLPVFTFDYEGNIKETVTDAYGWPNCDHEGNVMYENCHFPTKQEAIMKAIREYELGIKHDTQRQEELEQELEKIKARIDTKFNNVISFDKMLEGLK